MFSSINFVKTPVFLKALFFFILENFRSLTYDGNLISETDGAGNPLRDYVYLNGEPAAMKLYGDQSVWYYFLNDHLGTPQKIVNASGTLVWEPGYMPFGEARVLVADVENNLRFPGQYYDSETGLHYNYHRYYDPDSGRYLTPDPIGLAGGMNLYIYVDGNPVNWADKYGLQPHANFIKQVAKYTEKGLKSAIKKLRKNIVEHEATLADPAQKLAIKHHEHELRIFREKLKIVEDEIAKRGLLNVGGIGMFAEAISEEDADEATSSWFDWIDPNLGVGCAY